ncbi:phage tail tape measure protein [Plesiomonas shigelloides]|uniref:phage tail tape measure protein n=1 Tax=Plesiomonas shigelloides TaxID=703 RepID=UPI001262A919|nr:phage tail tape measure protein [Plesiomonas shigelloides]KAB7692620.1 phage tail tape measure protein [Plesiomonas shigelloides]
MSDIASLSVALRLNAATYQRDMADAFQNTERRVKLTHATIDGAAKESEACYARLRDSILDVSKSYAGMLVAGVTLDRVISDTRSYTKSLSDLSAITGATGEQLAFLDKQSRLIGQTTTLSASQAAEAFKLMASAKPDLLESNEALTKTTKSAVTLAEAAGMTLPDATKALALSLNQYSAGAEQADRYINVLAAGAKYGSSEIQETTEAIKGGGVAAAQAGVQFEELNAAIQTLAKSEIKGGEAGTALRNILLILDTATDRNLRPSVVGLSGALDNLAKKNLGTAQMVQMFGRENITAASVLLKNKELLKELTGQLTGTTTAYDQASTRTNNLEGDILSLSSAVEALSLSIGSRLNGAMRGGVQGVTESVNTLNANFDSIADSAEQVALPALSLLVHQGLVRVTKSSRDAWQAGSELVAKNVESAASFKEKSAAAVMSSERLRAQAVAERQAAQAVQSNLASQLAAAQSEKTRTAIRAQMAAQSGVIRTALYAEKQAIDAHTAALIRNEAGTLALQQAQRQATVTGRIFASALNASKSALAFVGGPVGLLTGALMAGAAAWYSYSEKTRQANQDLIDFAGSAEVAVDKIRKMNDIELGAAAAKLRQAIQIQTREAKEAAQEVERQQQAIQRAKGLTESPELQQMYADRLAVLKEKLAKANQQLSQSESTLQMITAQQTQGLADNFVALDKNNQQTGIAARLQAKVNEVIKTGNGLLQERISLVNSPVMALSAGAEETLAKLQREAELLKMTDKQRYVAQWTDKLTDATPREIQLIKQSAEAVFDQQEAIKASNKAKQESIRLSKSSAKEAQEEIKRIREESMSRVAQIADHEQTLLRKIQSYEAAKLISTKQTESLRTLIQENAARERLALVSKYSPVAAIRRDQAEALKEIKELQKAGAMSAQESQDAVARARVEAMRRLAQEQSASAVSALDALQGEFDPLKALQNELSKKKALYDAYYRDGVMSKQQYQYQMLQMSEQGAAQELEIQQSMFKSQSSWHAASLNAINAVADRTANSLTGLIMGTQSLADVMRSASATILQTMIQTLVEVTVKAWVARSAMSFFGFGGGIGTATTPGLGDLVPDIPSFAGMFDSGGYIPSGSFGIAGETGPEFVMGPAQIVSRRDTAQMLGGGQRTVQITLHNTFQTSGEGGLQAQLSSWSETMKQQMYEIAQMAMVDESRPGGILTQ